MRPTLTMIRLACTSALSMVPASDQKLKVLCLHGYAQNGAVLRDRRGGPIMPHRRTHILTFASASQVRRLQKTFEEEPV